nr:UDP-phosphate alpha-N-acetylglucosaminephosphotransferase [uncultured Lichenicoccus sp.]
MRLAPAAGLPPSLLVPLCVAALLVSSVAVRLMIRIGVLDRPGHRSAHVRPTPKGGGVGPVLALLLLLPLALVVLPAGNDAGHGAGALLLAVAVLAAVSWLDDLRQYGPLVKLAAQAACAALVAAAVAPSAPDAWPVPAIGFCWLMFATNALNFIDGLNGLAAGSMALCAAALGLDAKDPLTAIEGLLLSAGLVGFLPFNYPRARIFLGDVGSQGAGLAVAACALQHWRHDASIAGVLAGPLLLAGILYDVAFTLCRRALRGERLSEAHRGHLYQVAFRAGVPAWLVTLAHWGFVAWGAMLLLALQRSAGGSAMAVGAVIAAALLPQLAWTQLVIQRARAHPVGRW